MNATDEVFDYSTASLIEVAKAAQHLTWHLKDHPETADALTIHCSSGYVINPRGFVNDDNDARFIATFDPPTVLRLLERLKAFELELTPAGGEAVSAKYCRNCGRQIEYVSVRTGNGWVGPFWRKAWVHSRGADRGQERCHWHAEPEAQGRQDVDSADSGGHPTLSGQKEQKTNKETN